MELLFLGDSLPPKAQRGSLSADVDRYLKQIMPLASWMEIRSHLRAWLTLHEDTPRWRLTGEDIRHARAEWIADGVAPKTVNHRVAALARLYHVLDGKRGQTPCDEIEPLSVPPVPPQPVSPAVIRKVLRTLEQRQKAGLLRDGKMRARFMVLAATGVRPAELMRAEASDLNLKEGWWRTRTAKGGYRPGGISLTKEMKHAWAVFIKEDAWGEYTTYGLSRTLRAAGWPATVRPYNLRHTVGMALAEAGADLADISAHLGHTRPLTTRSHYVPVTRGRMKHVADLLEGRLGWPVRDRGTGRRKTRKK